MTVAFPWSGRDVNALVPLSGRAAVPNTPAGAGFNWPSLVGRVSGYIRPVRGWGGMRGLGQTYDSEGNLISTDNLNAALTDFSTLDTSLGAPSLLTNLSAGAASGAASPAATVSNNQAPWYANILGSAISSGLKTGSQIATYQLNPLYQKQTYYQTPQGAIYASNAPAGSIIPGLTTGTGSSLLPILLIGGVLVLFMSMRK